MSKRISYIPEDKPWSPRSFSSMGGHRLSAGPSRPSWSPRLFPSDEHKEVGDYEIVHDYFPGPPLYSTKLIENPVLVEDYYKSPVHRSPSRRHRRRSSKSHRRSRTRRSSF